MNSDNASHTNLATNLVRDRLSADIKRVTLELTTLARSAGLISLAQVITLDVNIAENEGAAAIPYVEVIGQGIEVLDIPSSHKDKLKDQGITTLAQLISTSPRDIHRLRGIGEKGLYTINAELEKIGLALEHPIPRDLVWREGPTAYEQELEKVSVQPLEAADWGTIKEIEWKTSQARILKVMQQSKHGGITGQRMSNVAGGTHPQTVARYINEKFKRAKLLYRMKGERGRAHTGDTRKLNWIFRIGILPQKPA